MMVGITSTFLIFGNGHGLSAPGGNQTFYWLIDERTGKGRFYNYLAGYGAQLVSFEWSRPIPGTPRHIAGYTLRPFNAHRRWFKWEISWRIERFPVEIDAMRSELADFKAAIDRGY